MYIHVTLFCCFVVSDNIIYDATFRNDVALQSSYNTYDDVSRSQSVRGGESNHLELSESTFTATYETLNPGSGVYSEVTAQYAPQVQVN